MAINQIVTNSYEDIVGTNDTFVGRRRRLATSRLGGYGSPLAWAPGKGPTRGGRHLAAVTQRPSSGGWDQAVGTASAKLSD